MLDSDVSLLWHGPVWSAGRAAPMSAGDLPGTAGDVDLVAAFWTDEPVETAPLPVAILLDLAAIKPLNPSDFWAWLCGQISCLAAETPVILLCDGTESVPNEIKPHAMLPAFVSDTILFAMICSLQRALMRSEEARIRRLVFGRIPGYGAAPHYAGNSGLLVVGLGGRFLELQAAGAPKAEVVGALNPGIAATFLSQRAFDAVVLDGDLADMHENLYQIRRDARFAALPVLAVADHPDDVRILFDAGASDVLRPPLGDHHLEKRLATAIRMGKRRRLADRILSESHTWLLRQLSTGGLTETAYADYLRRASQALGARGLELHEMKLAPKTGAILAGTPSVSGEIYGTILSVADATSRDEDLVCVVRNLGPVAVLKSERGRNRLQSRIKAILGHTVL